jgi:hypothetical protein
MGIAAGGGGAVTLAWGPPIRKKPVTGRMSLSSGVPDTRALAIGSTA